MSSRHPVHTCAGCWIVCEKVKKEWTKLIILGRHKMAQKERNAVGNWAKSYPMITKYSNQMVVCAE